MEIVAFEVGVATADATLQAEIDEEQKNEGNDEHGERQLLGVIHVYLNLLNCVSNLSDSCLSVNNVKYRRQINPQTSELSVVSVVQS